MDYQTGCLFCGAELQYYPDVRSLACQVCSQSFETQTACAEGHYVCDSCHALGALDWIESYCLQTPETDPSRIAQIVMGAAQVKMHGPEHHFLVPAALLTAVYNLESLLAEKKDALRKARKRSENVLGCFCGFYGACGAGVGTGIFLSVLTGASPLSEREWQLANQLTAQSLGLIAEHGGPRCCKRDTFLALQAAVAFLREQLSIALPLQNPIRCEFSHLNRECRTEACPFYTGSPSPMELL